MSNFFINKKVLVTGAAGFIGSHLVRKLKALGSEVEVFDSKYGDNIQNIDQIKSVIRKKYDIVYHLAGMSGSVNRDPIRFLEVNALPTISLTKFIAELSPQTKLIISGTRLEYGIPIYIPVDENHPTCPNSDYGWSKLVASEMSLNYAKDMDMDVVVFRTSNVYGPHPKVSFRGFNVINYFIDLAVSNKDIEIYGDGLQKRDYIYVEDLVSAFLVAGEKSKGSQIYNIGYGEGVTFKEMVEIIIKEIGKGEIKYTKWPSDYKSVETGDYITNTDKIKKLGFISKINFKEGIRRTINEL